MPTDPAWQIRESFRLLLVSHDLVRRGREHVARSNAIIADSRLTMNCLRPDRHGSRDSEHQGRWLGGPTGISRARLSSATTMRNIQ
jgi:hypothetical protein